MQARHGGGSCVPGARGLRERGTGAGFVQVESRERPPRGDDLGFAASVVCCDHCCLLSVTVVVAVVAVVMAVVLICRYYSLSRTNRHPACTHSTHIRNIHPESVLMYNEIRVPWVDYETHFFFFFAHFYFPASGQAVLTGVVPSSPRFLPSIFIAHRVQQSHCSSIFHRVLLTHALAFSANQLVSKKNSSRIYTSMHLGGFELTKLTYTRLEDNLIRHRATDTLWHDKWRTQQ